MAVARLQVVTAANPSFVALDPTQTHLYSTNENLVGGVSAYAIQGNGRSAFSTRSRRTAALPRT